MGAKSLHVICAESLSHTGLFVTPRTVAHQTPRSMGFPQARILAFYCHEPTTLSIQPLLPPLLCFHNLMYRAASSNSVSHPLAHTVPSTRHPGIFLCFYISAQRSSLQWSLSWLLQAEFTVLLFLIPRPPVCFSIVELLTLHIYDFLTRQLSPQDYQFLKGKGRGLIILSQ